MICGTAFCERSLSVPHHRAPAPVADAAPSHLRREEGQDLRGSNTRDNQKPYREQDRNPQSEGAAALRQLLSEMYGEP